MVRLGVIIAAAVLVVDRFSKWWVLAAFAEPGEGVVLAPFFNVVLVMNTGVSFGLLKSDTAWVPWVLILFAAVIVVILFAWMARVERRWLAGAIGLVLGGAVGNIIDRISYGAVVDFLDFHWGGQHWPAFNVADSAIVVGVAAIVIAALFGRRERGT